MFRFVQKSYVMFGCDGPVFSTIISKLMIFVFHKNELITLLQMEHFLSLKEEN